MAEPAAYELDEYGFPVVPCGRCAGSGNLPAYHRVHHGVCFACQGSGHVYPTEKIKREASFWRSKLRDVTSVRTSRSITYRPDTGEVTEEPGNLYPSMDIRPVHRGVRQESWRRVWMVRWTARLVSWGQTGDPPTDLFWSLGSVVLFTDRTVVHIDSQTWEAKPTEALLTRGLWMAAQSRKHYDRVLMRRAGIKVPSRRGLDRHAVGDELACGAGGCRNLAVWLLRSDLYPGRNWMSCNLHKDSRRELMIKHKAARVPEIVPLEDPDQRPPRKKTRPTPGSE